MLVCDKAWVKPFIVSVMLIGKAVGVFFTGTFSDQFGRKPVYLVSTFVNILAMIGIALAHNIYIYAVLMLLMGASSLGIYADLFLIGSGYSYSFIPISKGM